MKLSNVRSLTLTDCVFWDNHSLSSLSDMKLLTTLRINDSDFAPGVLDSLTSCTQLTELALRRMCSVDDGETNPDDPVLNVSKPVSSAVPTLLPLHWC